MDESYLPWWLIVLIGMWAVALTVWQHPAVHREVRLWAGLLTLAYLGMFFLALGRIPGGEEHFPGAMTHKSLLQTGFAICAILGLTSCVWFVGRVTGESRRFSYITLTLANSAVALMMQCPEIAAGLFVVAGLSAWPVFRKWGRSRSVPRLLDWTRDLLRFREGIVPRDKSGIVWLAGCQSGILACLLLGTIAYSVRYEVSRATANTRLTALPSRNVLERYHAKSEEKATALHLIFGLRSEIFVLLAVILFLSLAITSGEESDQKDRLLETSNRTRTDG